jgi:cell division transport system permease protein
VDQNLRGLFERVLDDEPAPSPDLARTAMAQGTRLRRRRTLVVGGAGGVVAAIATVLALNLTGTPAAPPPPVAAAGLGIPTATVCTKPVPRTAKDIRFYLRPTATQSQVLELHDGLIADARVESLSFESRQQAYERFKVRWKESPDLIKTVKPEDLPDSFGIGLKEPSAAPGFVAKFRSMAVVDQVVVDNCLVVEGR